MVEDMNLPSGSPIATEATNIQNELNDATGLEDLLAAIGKAQDFMIDNFTYVKQGDIDANTDVSVCSTNPTKADQLGLTGTEKDQEGVYTVNPLTGKYIKADRLDGSVRVQDFNESVMNITSNATSVEQTKKAATKKVDQLTG